MTPGIFLLLICAGGVGAGVRFVVDGTIRSRVKQLFSWPTAVINLSGSLVLGFLTGLVASGLASTEASAVLGTGFLGGYTTFSTASYETVQLIRQKHYGTAFVYGFGVLVASIALAYLGYRWGLNA
ncbi:fluoride efflux transporter FluC [Nocardioides jishulii]|uniref:Fluoride-specific ion channel FluC n=1 Tax=Nocardioides jishulii TaxID=2575440 RepID=A0A4U2YP56_9ACTN|nr:CrcB family protein [Nocardioides jishulii]QCX27827.1 CrcB family protein [Nocardioides jishulii]TKI62634.1 CrcB family protein [Nocardioides jishulii]